MSRTKGFYAPAVVDASDPEVMISQISAFSQQVPLLYIISNVNTIALAYTHYNVAPRFLTLIVPIPMLLASLIRISVWFRALRQTFTAKQAAAQLRGMIVMTGILGAVYTPGHWLSTRTATPTLNAMLPSSWRQRPSGRFSA